MSRSLFSRRQFVKGLAVSGSLIGMGVSPATLLASTSSTTLSPVLTGKNFNLTIAPETVNFTGTRRTATAINGSIPAPILRWKEGETVSLRVKNQLSESSSIHWHGMILPERMDGVPGISFDGIAPGESYHYHFKIKQSGTYWYHSHSAFQEQTGMYGAIIVDPVEPEPYSYDRDYVLLLSDWSDEDPNSIYAKLKKLSHYYNFNERTAGTLIREIKEKGLTETWNDRAMWNWMRMSDRDLSDVTGYTYT